MKERKECVPFGATRERKRGTDIGVVIETFYNGNAISGVQHLLFCLFGIRMGMK